MAAAMWRINENEMAKMSISASAAKASSKMAKINENKLKSWRRNV
jgi:hypothetical protein